MMQARTGQQKGGWIVRLTGLLGALAMLASLTGGCYSGSAAPDAQNPARVAIALNWLPDAQHGGFYAADQLGYFASAGLTMEIQPGGPATPNLQNLALGRVPFAVGNADQVLMARAQGMPIVAIFAAMQTSPRCILLHRAAGIDRFEDLRDLTLALGTGKAFAAYLRKHLPLENVTIVPYTGSLAPFLADTRFAQQGYLFSEPYVARQQGADPLTLQVADLGFNPYTSCLLTHEEEIRERPERVRAVVQAVQRGWAEYLRDPAAVNQHLQQLNPQMDAASLAFGAEALRPLCLPEGMAADQIGHMDPARWEQLNQQLIALSLVPATSDATLAYSNRFLAPASPEPTQDQSP